MTEASELIEALKEEIKHSVYDAFHNLSQPSMAEHRVNYGSMLNYVNTVIKINTDNRFNQLAEHIKQLEEK